MAKKPDTRACNHCGSANSPTAEHCKFCKRRLNSVAIAIPLSSVEDAQVERLGLHGHWGFCFGGGIATSTSTLIGGAPGAGKSTLVLHLLAALANMPTCLYLATEEKLIRIRQRANRLGIPKDRQDKIMMVRLVPGEDVSIEQLIKATGAKVAVLDSVNMLVSGANDAVAVMQGILTLCEKQKTTFITTSHVTKAGDFAGLEGLQHTVDCTQMFYPDESKVGVPRVWEVFKNRNGRAFIKQYYSMEENGLVLIGQEGDEQEGDEDEM